MTYTYVTMDVTKPVFEEVKRKLQEAEYHHAIHNEGKTLDMHGIALVNEEADKDTVIQIRFDNNTGYLWVGDNGIVSTKTSCYFSEWGVDYDLVVQHGTNPGVHLRVQTEDGEPIGEFFAPQAHWVTVDFD